MRIRPLVRRPPDKKTPPGARGAARAAAASPRGAKAAAAPTGLSGFAVDASSPVGQEALAPAPVPRGVRGASGAAAPPPLKRMAPEAAALEHLDRALASDALKQFVRPRMASCESEFKSLGTQASPLTGSTVVRFRQTFHKIPVYGSLVTVELDADNACLGINSSLGTPQGVDHVAKVAPADALATAAKAAGVKAALLTQTPRLYYYFDQHAATWRLAWIIEDVAPARPKGRTAAPGDAILKDYVVDGHSGKLLAELPRVATMAAAVEVVVDANRRRRRITVDTGSGASRALRDPTLNVTTYSFGFRDPSAQDALLPGRLYEAPPPEPWPPEAIGAHANGSEVARFLRTVVKRVNIDDRGGEMISSVNCWDRAESTKPAKEWKNAYWNGRQMVYGQVKFPDGSFYSVASMLDVVGHEMFHGVTDNTSRLEYRTQAGALNESYSDIFGVIIANFSRPLAKWVWRIGTNFDGPGTALRDLRDPSLHDQPMHMRDFRTSKPPYTWSRNDYGWVHDNSGIHNHAAYRIMTAKAAGRFLFTKRELAALFFIALTLQLSRTSQFADSRRAVVQAARSLFRKDTPATRTAKVKAVEDGFAAVGIA